jgi:DNA-directed RNA polymerase subunit K/omega
MSDIESDFGDADLQEEIEHMIINEENKETEDIDIDDKQIEALTDEEDIEYDEEAPEEEKPPIQKLIMHDMIPPEDSRLPDVMSSFEYTQILIARSIAISKGSAPLVSVNDCADPVEVAKLEIKLKVTNKSILREDNYDRLSEWRITDFAYFPMGSIENIEEYAPAFNKNYLE